MTQTHTMSTAALNHRIQRSLLESRVNRENELHPAPRDYILRPAFRLVVLFFQSTLLRLAIAIYIFPIWCTYKFLEVCPDVLSNASELLTHNGRARLRQSTDAYRKEDEARAAQQFAGTYQFNPKNVLAYDHAHAWKPNRVEINVCGVKCRIIHVKPLLQNPDSKQIIMVHGNPSWSYIWRNVIPFVTGAGHEIFAIDWVGHGASDKPTSPREISFELHMQTLITVVKHFNLDDFYIAAHDWGGCVVLCTIPVLPPEHHCSGLFMLNTFFPPSRQDISFHYYLLYWIWFFTTGVVGPILPDSLVLRFMAPIITYTITEGFSIPYRQHPTKARASINRFAHMVPGTPDMILSFRNTRPWRLFEGLIGPAHMTNISAQASLADRNVEVRRWWRSDVLNEENLASSTSSFSSSSSGSSDSEKRVRFDANTDRTYGAPERIMILFGEDDPLLLGFRSVIAKTIKVSKHCESPEGKWISDAGHYPMEEKPELIARSIDEFVMRSSRVQDGKE